jgi:succinate dehydrogenase / fumarate reductase, iron-sulfur subunit
MEYGSSLEKIIQAGSYISVSAGVTSDADALPVSKCRAELAMDGAAWIGCGASVAACPKASASLFIDARVSHIALLPP